MAKKVGDEKRKSSKKSSETRKDMRKRTRKEKTSSNSGPRLPSALKREIDFLNPTNRPSDNDDEDSLDDAYEYEEGLAEEETTKNRRFDPVDNLEYELPEEFEDEDLPSDDDVDDEDEGDEDKHARMLEGITGIPAEAFKERRKEQFPMDADICGEYDTGITLSDLWNGESASKTSARIGKKPIAVLDPLPKVQREKMERQVAYEYSKKDITLWDPLVKRNREAPTIFFQEVKHEGFSSVGAIAAGFKPRTEFEQKMAMLVNDPRVVEAHKNDGLKLLELNEISVEDVKERQNRLAKMRSLLFRHDMKQNRIKKIKSKTYHRMLKKDRTKAASDEMLIDPEAIQEQAFKQEYKRAEERLTLKHKNKSKWAQRNIKRGLKAQDEGTRAAMAEQLRQHELLTRKMNSMKNSSSEDNSDDEDEDNFSGGEDGKDASNLLMRAKEKTAKLIEEEEPLPSSGVLSLPFMVRGLKKKKDAADEEARLALQDYDLSLEKIEDVDGTEVPELVKSSGRKVFGAPQDQPAKSTNRRKREIIDNSSDSEADYEIKKGKDGVDVKTNDISGAQNDLKLPVQHQVSQLQTYSDTDTNSTAKTTHEVSMFVSGSWKKMNDGNSAGTAVTDPNRKGDDVPIPQIKVTTQDSDAESDQEMVEGFITSGNGADYELPSQDELIRRAFAGDDVEVEFEKDKMEVLNDENPEPEKPALLPGWGQWTHVQKKKGLPSWMVKEHEDAKRKRDEALKKRKDAHLKHVIISEKADKKALKLHTTALPFPFTSNEVYEQSIRMPIGPDYNPSISVGALNRPSVVKEDGVIIKPIKFEEVDPHDKSDEPNRSKHKPKRKGKQNKRKTGSRN